MNKPMFRCIGTKIVNAAPLTRGEYDALRGWETPADKNPEDAGYLVEYVDGGKPNHPEFVGYISWSPADVFANAVRTDALNEIASELEQHNSHWEAWYLRQRAAGVMPQFDEEAANGVQAAAGGLTQTALEC